VERMIRSEMGSSTGGGQWKHTQEQKALWRTKFGLDLPVFYFSLAPISVPDTLYKIPQRKERYALRRLIDQYGNWTEIQRYYRSLDKLQKFHLELSADQGGIDMPSTQAEIAALRSAFTDEVIVARIANLQNFYKDHPSLLAGTQLLREVNHSYRLVKIAATAWKNYIPTLKLYWNNQYHRWLFGDGHWLTGNNARYTKGVIRGDFGVSFITKQPVSKKIGEKIMWSVLLTVISVLFAYLISIPVGLFAATQRGSWFDRLSGITVFILYSMPSFWVAVLLLMTFANSSNFSDGVAWLPASGVMPLTGYPEGAGIFEKLRLSLPYLILPTICYTYGSLAFLSRTMRASMLEVVHQDYIRTARAKGLLEWKVIFKHGLRNALLPLITVFANVFPLALGGSVILESIFTIPGMGNEIFRAVHNQDYPMIVAIFTLAGVLTISGFLISDILYVVVDPRISLSKVKSK